jgi:hypothetical protein
MGSSVGRDALIRVEGGGRYIDTRTNKRPHSGPGALWAHRPCFLLIASWLHYYAVRDAPPLGTTIFCLRPTRMEQLPPHSCPSQPSLHGRSAAVL